MGPVELLAYVAAALDEAGVDYLVCGSVAAIHYGEPRYTHDLDLVVDLREAHLAALRLHFASGDWYYDEAMIRDELARQGMFNILHIPSGLKVDCYLRQATAYAAQQWAGRRVVALGPASQVVLASAEDVILMKLVYYAEGHSDKHLRDIASILAVQGANLDLAYLARWAGHLQVAAIWEEVQAPP